MHPRVQLLQHPLAILSKIVLPLSGRPCNKERHRPSQPHARMPSGAWMQVDNLLIVGEQVRPLRHARMSVKVVDVLAAVVVADVCTAAVKHSR
jgi:hypothetical protein